MPDFKTLGFFLAQEIFTSVQKLPVY